MIRITHVLRTGSDCVAKDNVPLTVMRRAINFIYFCFQRFCMLDKKYIFPFQRMFQEQYETIHQLDTNKLRNVAKFFAHLLFTDAILWEVS